MIVEVDLPDSVYAKVEKAAQNAHMPVPAFLADIAESCNEDLSWLAPSLAQAAEELEAGKGFTLNECYQFLQERRSNIKSN